MEKVLYAQGHEHFVFKSRQEGRLLKIPTLANQLWFLLCGFKPEMVKKEFAEFEAMAENTRVKIPPSRIFAFSSWRFGYIIAQEEIKDDGSIKDIRKVLIEDGLNDLALSFDINSENFIPRSGFVYCIDPTHGISISSFFARKNLISPTLYQKIRQIETKVHGIYRGVIRKKSG